MTYEEAIAIVLEWLPTLTKEAAIARAVAYDPNKLRVYAKHYACEQYKSKYYLAADAYEFLGRQNI